jgi:hypothetical protein
MSPARRLFAAAVWNGDCVGWKTSYTTKRIDRSIDRSSLYKLNILKGYSGPFVLFGDPEMLRAWFFMQAKTTKPPTTKNKNTKKTWTFARAVKTVCGDVVCERTKTSLILCCTTAPNSRAKNSRFTRLVCTCRCNPNVHLRARSVQRDCHLPSTTSKTLAKQAIIFHRSKERLPRSGAIKK